MEQIIWFYSITFPKFRHVFLLIQSMPVGTTNYLYPWILLDLGL